MKRKKLFPVQLSCDHEILSLDVPKIGSVVSCYKCHRGSIVTFVRVYTARCRNCSYRNHEGDLGIASQRARQHSMQLQHEVSIWYPTIDTPIILVPTLSDVLSSLRQTA